MKKYVELFEELPVPRERGLQAVLDQDTDPKTKIFTPADFVDLSFLRPIGQTGLVENYTANEFVPKRATAACLIDGTGIIR